MVFLYTMAYCKAKYVREMLIVFQEQNDRSSYDRHALIDPLFPCEDQEINSKELVNIAKEFNLEYYKMEKNLGAHKNMQWAFENFGIKPTDLFAPICPDSRGTKSGWIKAMVNVLRADPDCFTCQLNHGFDYKLHGGQVVMVGNEEVLQFPGLVAWTTGMFNAGLIQSIGGFDAYSNFYGYTEHYLADKLVPLGKRWYLLKEYYDIVSSIPDPKYTKWKIDSASGATKVSYEEWLGVNK